MQFHVFAALAEFERNLIRERTLAGLSAGRVQGRVGGRKPKLSDKQIREIKSLLSDLGGKVHNIVKRYGVSRTTLYKRVRVVSAKKSQRVRFSFSLAKFALSLAKLSLRSPS